MKYVEEYNYLNAYVRDTKKFKPGTVQSISIRFMKRRAYGKNIKVCYYERIQFNIRGD